MENDEQIDGVVARVEHYGLYVKTPKGEAVVLISDVSQERIPDVKEAYNVGDKVRLQLLHFVEAQGLYKATMRLDAQS